MKTNRFFLNIIAITAILTFASCSKDDNEGGEPNPDNKQANKYVVIANSADNDYLVAGKEVNSSTEFDATSKEAVQAAGSRFWTFYNEDVVYGFIYNQTDAGVTASYVLDKEGKVKLRNELGLATSIHTRGIYDNSLILAYSDRLRDPSKDQKAYFYKINPKTDAVSKPFELVTNNVLEDGEAAYFTDIAEYEGKLIAGARSINSKRFSSDYYNNTYVVVFNDDFTVKQVIKDEGRTGFVAGQRWSQGETGLEVIDNGDLYVFSSGQTNYADANTKTIPSGILKINKGEFKFDADYFFDVTAASGGYNMFRTYYTGGTTFLVIMYPGKNDKATFGVDADRLAIVDVATKSFKWVTGFPSASGVKEDPFRVGVPFVDKANNQVLVPVTTSTKERYIYNINPSNAVATKGSKVNAEGVKAIGILSNKK